MADFQAIIINRLLTLYEKRKQSWKSDTKSRVVRLIVEKEPLFKNYAHSSQSYLFRDDVEKDVAALEDAELIIVTKDKNTGLLKNIDLNLKTIDKAYDFVKRTSLNDTLENEKRIVEALLEDNKEFVVLKGFLESIFNLIINHKSRDRYYKSIDELTLTVQIISSIIKQDEDIFLRVFSKKKFNDSKLVEKKEAKIMQIFNEFGDKTYESFSDLLEDHNIVKNKGSAVAKQGLLFKINNQTIDLDLLGEEFYFSIEMLLKMRIEAVRKTKVITVENLTTFYSFKDNDAVILYLGGFHNSAKRELIRKIYNFNPNLVFYHFGDIDCGGIEILLDLRNKTGIDFKPLLMGIEQLEKYKTECQPLTKNDRKRLKNLLTTNSAAEFRDTIYFMLEHNIKLEQESIE